MQAVWDAKTQFDTLQTKDIFDCYIAEALLCEGRYNPQEEQALLDYHVTTLTELAEKQKAKLKTLPKLEKLFFTVEMPLVPILHAMEEQGISLNTKKLTEIGTQILKEREKVATEITSEIGFTINLNSSQQVGEYLAEKEGVPLGRTKTGKYATNETELMKFAPQFAIIQKIILYRELAKLHSTYIKSLIEKVDAESRVHTTYHQVFINTGRLASTNPNLQNIPTASTFGVQIKSCFQASSGNTLLSFDYSQQELRILAHLSGEEKLLAAFANHDDVHALTASQIFNVSQTEITKLQRRVGKTINFGIIYGMSSFGLSESLQIPVSDAEVFIKEFYNTFPKIKAYYDSYLAEAKKYGFVETILGRRRYVFEDPKRRFIDNSTRRVLMNFPMQGSAADLMKLAMVNIDNQILQKNKNIHLLLQIHDDLVFEVSDKDEASIKTTAKEITDIMCSVYPLRAPFEVSVTKGKNWGEMKAFIQK